MHDLSSETDFVETVCDSQKLRIKNRPTFYLRTNDTLTKLNPSVLNEEFDTDFKQVF